MNSCEPRRYLSKDLFTVQPQLKQLDTTRKQELIKLSDQLHPIVIDFGSENILAGYECGDCPELIFRPQVAKNRDLSKGDVAPKASINTSYDQLDFVKNNFKSPYERNIVLHFSLLQQCNDYIFGELARPNKRIRNPLVISEPLANPLHCRDSLLQQLFECYEVDSVMIGVDALFAYFYELGCSMSRYESQSSLVINMGATTIHLLPIIRGRVDFKNAQRINIGGNNAFQLFSKSILLKYSHLREKLNYSFMRHIYDKFTFVSIDYRRQLQFFQRPFKSPLDMSIYRNRVLEQNKMIDEGLIFENGVQIDFDSVVEVPEEELRRKEEVRKRMSEKLKDTLQRRKQMKKKMHQVELQNYLELRERYQSHDKFAHEEVVEMFGEHHPLEKLQKRIKTLEAKLGLVSDKPEDEKFNLISIPDHQLPPEKRKYKKLQIYQKQALELRRQKQREREQEQVRMKELRENNPELYLHQLKQTYKDLYDKIKDNERIKSELSNRKSKLKQRKMQAIARLAQQDFDPEMQQGEDDWLVFKDLEESDHYSELEAMEAELREIDPEWTQAKDHHHLKEINQLFLQTDLTRCHEIYFQPLMIGVNQIDIVTAISRILANYPISEADLLRKNIVLVGGGSQVKGLEQRLRKDLTRQSPTGSTIGVAAGKGGCFGAFRGMQYIARYQKQWLERFSVKREDYLSKGGSIFVENPWSNPRPKV